MICVNKGGFVMIRSVKLEACVVVASLGFCLVVCFLKAQAAPCPVKCASKCKLVGGYYYDQTVCWAYCDDNDCTNFVKSCTICDVGSCCQPNDKQICCNLFKAIRHVRFEKCDAICPPAALQSVEADSFQNIQLTNSGAIQYDCKDPVSGKCP